MPKLYITDPEALTILGDLEGPRWLERQRADEGVMDVVGGYFINRRAFEILRELGPDAAQLPLEDIAPEAGFIRTVRGDPIYRVEPDGEILLLLPEGEARQRQAAEFMRGLDHGQLIEMRTGKFDEADCEKVRLRYARMAENKELLPHRRQAIYDLMGWYEVGGAVAEQYYECGKQGYAEVAGHANEQWLVPVTAMQELDRRIARVTRKAKKIGASSELGYAVVGERIDPVLDEARRPTGKVKVYKIVELSGSAPRVAGYQFVARVTHMGALNMVARAPDMYGLELPRSIRTDAPTCEHCHLDRRRNETFVLREAKTGKLIRVGRQCLRDFLGTADLAEALSLWSVIDTLTEAEQSEGDEEKEVGWGGARHYDALDDFVSRSFRAIEVSGWVSATAAREDSSKVPTVAMVHFGMAKAPSQADSYKHWVQLQPTPESRELAKTAIEWAKSLEPTSDYEFNLKALAEAGYVPPRGDGVAASMAFAYKKHIGDIEQKKIEAQRPVSRFFGEPGNRYLRHVTIERVSPVEGIYGTTYIVLAVDDDGNRLKWFSSRRVLHPGPGAARPIDSGDALWMLFAVKKHEVYRDKRETTITRAEVFEQPAAPKWHDPTTGRVFGTKKEMLAAAKPNPTGRQPSSVAKVRVGQRAYWRVGECWCTVRRVYQDTATIDFWGRGLQEGRLVVQRGVRQSDLVPCDCGGSVEGEGFVHARSCVRPAVSIPKGWSFGGDDVRWEMQYQGPLTEACPARARKPKSVRSTRGR